jgi:hypothetical protein
MDNYFIIVLTCWMSNRNIVCPDLRKLPGLATNNMQHFDLICPEVESDINVT